MSERADTDTGAPRRRPRALRIASGFLKVLLPVGVVVVAFDHRDGDVFLFLFEDPDEVVQA